MGDYAPYELVASEYYDPRHRTSRNFDATTVAALASLDLAIPDGLVLDVGCGRGRCGEFLNVPPERVVQLDNSAAMLALQPREGAILQVLHDAESLPFPGAAFGTVAAFLCDPFLGLNFLSEARRVLKPAGRLIATTPAADWGLALRGGLQLDAMTTRFLLRDGSMVHAPSALYSVDQLRRMLVAVGFPGHNLSLRTHRLPPGTSPVSLDIEAPAASLGVSPFELELLCTVVAEA